MFKSLRFQITSLVLAAVAALGSSFALLTPIPADAAISFAGPARNARCTATITFAGSSAKLKAYSGARPVSTGLVTAGNTLLAAGAFGLTLGTCTNGVLTMDGAGFVQTNTTFVSGAPTFFDITTGSDVVVARVDVCGTVPCWTFTGSVVNGQNITLTALSLTEGNQ